MTETIMYYIISLAPSIVAICTSIGAIVSILKKFASLREDVHKKVEMEELKEKLEIAMSDSKELQRLLKKEIETRTHIKEE